MPVRPWCLLRAATTACDAIAHDCKFRWPRSQEALSFEDGGNIRTQFLLFSSSFAPRGRPVKNDDRNNEEDCEKRSANDPTTTAAMTTPEEPQHPRAVVHRSRRRPVVLIALPHRSSRSPLLLVLAKRRLDASRLLHAMESPPPGIL